MMPYDDIIEKHANRVGIDPAWMKRIMRIESGGDASNTTGSYKGLFQLSNREFRAGGGTGNIYDPEQNTMAAANTLARHKLAFREKTGRDPNLGDLYMIHQQGEAGAAAHAANPDKPAWENVRKYYSSDAMAKKAIWGNVPDNLKAQFGSVENITSGQFSDMWSSKLEGRGEVSGTQWATHRKGKTPEDQAMSRGTILGEEPEKPEGKVPEWEGVSIQSPPGINVPTMAASVPSRALRAPQIPGASRF